MSLKNGKRIYKHALAMVKEHRKSYILLSITIFISLGIVFAFLLFYDTRSFNNNKEFLKYPDNVGQVGEFGNNKETKEIFKKQMVGMKDTAVETWFTSSVNLSVYENYDKLVNAKVYYTNRDFFNYPVCNTEFDRVDLIEGRLYTQSEIANDENVIVIDKSLSKAFGNDSILNKKLKIPVKDANGNFHYEDFQVVGVVSNRSDTKTVQKENDIELIQVDIYVPITQRNSLYMQSPLEVYDTIISNKLREVTRLAMTQGIYMTSMISTKDMINKEMSDATIVKAIILLIMVVILNINMFSTLSNLIKDRQKEIGIKRALGISNKKIILQFFIEMLLVLLSNVVVITVFGTSFSYIALLLYNFLNDATLVLYIQPYSLLLYFIISLFLILGNSLLISYLTTRVDIIQNIKAE